MTIFAPNRSVLSVGIAAAMLAGCGGSQPPIGAPGAMLFWIQTPLNRSRHAVLLNR
jgi:hypothetical protein